MFDLRCSDCSLFLGLASRDDVKVICPLCMAEAEELSRQVAEAAMRYKTDKFMTWEGEVYSRLMEKSNFNSGLARLFNGDEQFDTVFVPKTQENS